MTQGIRDSFVCQFIWQRVTLRFVTLIDTAAVEDGARRVVKMLMARDGMSQQDLADLLHVSRQQASQRLACKAKFTFAELVLLADHFGVTIADFGPASRFLDVDEGAAVRKAAGRLVRSTFKRFRRSWHMRHINCRKFRLTCGVVPSFC